MSSVLTSLNMNVDRSTTRVHAPPGGKTSICFGEDPVQKPPAPPAPVVVEAPVEVSVAVVPTPEIVISGDFKVGVVVASGEGSDEALAALKAGLSVNGVTNVTVSTVSDAFMLPFATQLLLQSTDVVIALGGFSNDSLMYAVISALLQVGAVGVAPVVPALYSTAIADVATASGATWAKAALELLALKAAPAPSPQATVDAPAVIVPPVVEAVLAPPKPSSEVVQPSVASTFAGTGKPSVAPSRSVNSFSTNPGRQVGGRSSLVIG